MPHPFLVGTALLTAGVAALRLYRREQQRVRDVLDRMKRQDTLDALPAQRLERDPLTGIYRLPDDRASS